MKKITAILVSVVAVLSMATISANAGNLSSTKTYSEAMEAAYNDIHSTALRTMVMGVEKSFEQQGYTVISMKGNTIKAIKTTPSEKEVAKNQKKEFKKVSTVKTPTLTAKFTFSDEAYKVDIEKGYDLQSYNEWASMVDLHR